MNNLQYIKGFFFDSAKYRVSDEQGDVVLLHIDYKNNTFSIKEKGLQRNSRFRQEIRKVAVDLLRRKHGVNRANTKEINQNAKG